MEVDCYVGSRNEWWSVTKYTYKFCSFHEITKFEGYYGRPYYGWRLCILEMLQNFCHFILLSHKRPSMNVEDVCILAVKVRSSGRIS